MIPITLVFVRRLVCNVTRFTWRSSARFTKMKTRQQLLVFVALIFILLVYYGYSQLTSRGYIKVLPVNKRTVQNYCNFPANINGAEGSLPGKDSDFQLEMVQVLQRHGDRAPFKNIPGMERIGLDCSMKPQDEKAKLFSGYLDIVNDITVRKLSPKAVLHDLVSRSDKCYRGQMTQKGFQQLFEIGRHFKNAYSKLIKEEIKSKHLYARSTDTGRTTQTVAALLYGFLDKSTFKQGHISINVSIDVFFRENNKGVVIPCPAYGKLMRKTKQSQEYKAGSTAMEPLMSEMSKLLLRRREVLQNVIALADACLVHFCHGVSLPCAVGGCISESSAFKLISYADWAFSHNYSQAADMISIPVLTQIATRMVDKAEYKTSSKFAVYGGHDISVMSVLMSLGIHEHRWIPYASRLVFEFWRKTGVSYETKQNQRQFIRVLFNGKTMTKKLTFCKGNITKSGELCPLEDFLRWLGGGNFAETQDRYEKLCNQ